MISYAAENLACSYGRQQVFRDLSFSVQQGEICMVTGANGSGKTSLLMICAGLMSPASGNFFRKDLADDTATIHSSDKNNPVLITPKLCWYKQLTVRENLEFYFHGERLRDETKDYLHEFSLDALMDRPLSQLSSGNIQRVSLAAAMSSTSPLLLLDEPSSHLDDKGYSVFKQLLTLKSKECACIVATHDSRDLEISARRVTLEKVM